MGCNVLTLTHINNHYTNFPKGICAILMCIVHNKMKNFLLYKNNLLLLIRGNVEGIIIKGVGVM